MAGGSGSTAAMLGDTEEGEEEEEGATEDAEEAAGDRHRCRCLNQDEVEIASLVNSYSEGWLRYFAAELVGTFVLTLLSGLFTWGMVYQYGVEFHANNPGWQPQVYNMHCSPTEHGSSCNGRIKHPLAGAKLSGNTLLACLASGLAFTCVSILSPGATLNPSFTLMLCAAGMKRWGLFLPSVTAQLLGVLLADLHLYWLLRNGMISIGEALSLTKEDLLRFGETFWGLTFPSPGFGNTFSFMYTVLSNVMFVFMMWPMSLRCATLPAVAQDFSKGLTIAIFACAFGANGLGTLPNPAQWLGGALFLTLLGHPMDVWSRNSHYGLKVPLVAPTVGIVIGSCLTGCYLQALYRKPPSDRGDGAGG